MSRSFTQTLQDVTVVVKLENGVKAKMLAIDFGLKHLSVRNKFTGEVYVDGDLFADIVPDECMWLVDSEKSELQMTLEKKEKTQWWPHVLTTDPKIDVTQIRPQESKLSDVDEKTRAQVERMMFDQQQKMRGLPTSEELQKRKTLEKFKKMHPELDFSRVE